MLPQYSKQYRPEDMEFDGDGSSQTFLSTSHKESTDREAETEPPLYPPTPPVVLEGRTIEYRYTPVFPRLGETRSAIGFMGKTRRETIQVVQNGFPDLAEIEPTRIRFTNENGAVILDEAWDHFTQSTSDPLKRLEIVVEDAPGDREQRDRRENITIFSILGVIALIIFAIFILVLTHRR